MAASAGSLAPVELGGRLIMMMPLRFRSSLASHEPETVSVRRLACGVSASGVRRRRSVVIRVVSSAALPALTAWGMA